MRINSNILREGGRERGNIGLGSTVIFYRREGGMEGERKKRRKGGRERGREAQ